MDSEVGDLQSSGKTFILKVFEVLEVFLRATSFPNEFANILNRNLNQNSLNLIQASRTPTDSAGIEVEFLIQLELKLLNQRDLVLNRKFCFENLKKLLRQKF